MKRKYVQKWMYLVMAASMMVTQIPASTLSMPRVFAEESTVPQTEGLLKAGSISVSQEKFTTDQPLARGTAGSDIFRIPCIITLENGDILTAADARYTEYRDFGGIDTIASVSSDGGKTWHYSYPIYFPDSKGSAGFGKATTAIDPALVQGPDGTIYCLADMNPTGVTTFDVWPGEGTGYITVDGKERLALTSSWENSATNPKTAATDKYEYYVGDFSDGFAPVLKRADHTPSQYVVDEWYNIYTVSGEEKTPLTQKVINDNTTDIQQNAFYKDSVLHVYKTGYIWMVESKDNGRSWQNPRILNTMVKKQTTETALLVSPGQGITTSKGDIIVGCYETIGGEQAGFFYSNDNGETWKRTAEVNMSKSSENEMVELEDGTIRMFYRNDHMKICYVDATRDDKGDYTFGQPVKTDISSSSNCNVTAIKLKERKMDGKPVILVGNPNTPGAWNRNEGRIHVFTENEDKSMDLVHTYHINEGTYAYSCMTELENGNIGLLWEPGINEESEIRYDEIDIEKILGVDQSKELILEKGQEYQESYITTESMEVGTEPNEEVATVDVEVDTAYRYSLFDRSGNANTSEPRKSFSETANSAISLENAEFEFQAQEGEGLYKIYNAFSNTYLTNATSATNFFGSAANMKVVKVGEGENTQFRISKADSTRYIMFYFDGMNFNGNSGGYNSSMSNGTQELVLLEKQDTVSEDDIIKGYKKATSITDGKKYLITYITGNNVIILYPTNGTDNQTKLIDTSVAPKVETRNTVKFTPVENGTTTAVIGGNAYKISVKTPVIDSGLVSVEAGSQQSASGANSAAAAIDGDFNTHWQTHATNDKSSYDNHWITFDLGRKYQVDGLRYSTRWNGSKGSITKYKIFTSLDGEEFTEVPAAEGGTGEWDFINRAWYEADFTKREARYVRLQVVESRIGAIDSLLSTAAEIQIRGVKASPDADYSKVDEAIALVPEDLTGYTKGSVKELQNLIDSIIRDYGAEQQEEVDALAQAIKDAIAALEVEGSITSTKIPNVTIEAVGSQNKTSGNESATASLDGSASTFWHSNYSNGTDIGSYENHWLIFDLGKNYMVNQLRYMSRPSGNNGNIKKYEISISLDGNEYTKILQDTWGGTAATWYEADFRAREARYVKLKVLDATSENANKFSTASEFEIMGYEKTETPGGEGEEQHTPATEWSKNEDGHWHACDFEGCEEDQKHDFAEHAWDTGVVSKEPTATEEGEKTFTCSVCGQTKTEELPTTGETPGGEEEQQHTPTTEWSKDETSHWHACTFEGCEENQKHDVAEHTWDTGIVSKEPTQTEEGEKTFTCSICGQTKTESVPSTGGQQPGGQQPGGQQPGGQQPGGNQPGGDTNQDGSTDTTQKEVQEVKDTLNDTIKAAGVKLESAYTKESFNAYQNALQAAQAVLNKTNATKEEITAAQIALQKAISELKAAEPAQPQLSTQKGTKFEDAKGIYQFKIKNDTEAVFTGVSKNVKTVKIANTVTYAGKTFKVTEVAAKALKDDKVVTKINVGKNVKTIGASAFEGCEKLTSVSLGNNTTKIGNKALKGCKALKKVTIPKKVTNLGKSVFEGCTKLSTITVKATGLTKVGKNTFKGISAKAKVKVPKKSLAKYKKLLKNKGQGKKVTIK